MVLMCPLKKKNYVGTFRMKLLQINYYWMFMFSQLHMWFSYGFLIFKGNFTRYLQ